MTFQLLLTQFLAARQSKACHAVYAGIAKRHFASWNKWPTMADIEDWHASLEQTPHHGNKGLVLLKAMFTWGVRRGLVKDNPAKLVKRHKVFSREMVMTSEQISLFLNCLDLMHPKMAAIGQVLLTTGCRLSEAREMKKTHVNWMTGQWYQPHTKNGKPHTTYLPTQARHAIQSLSSKTEYVFAGAYEHCWSRPGVEKVWGQTRKALGMDSIRLHDFRRTLSTFLHEATHDDFLVKKCINHHVQSVSGIYIRVRYEHVAQALQAQADRFYQLAKDIPHDTRPQFETELQRVSVRDEGSVETPRSV